MGPFAPAGPVIVAGQEAFWQRVNEDGGIGGYDVDVTEYVRDNQYNPQVTNQVYQEIKPDILALAQTLGSPPTAAIVEDLEAENIVAAPAGWTSLYLFQDAIVESGPTYCAEAMNGVDYAVETNGAESVMAVHYAGDYGGDAAAGAKHRRRRQRHRVHQRGDHRRHGQPGLGHRRDPRPAARRRRSSPPARPTWPRSSASRWPLASPASSWAPRRPGTWRCCRARPRRRCRRPTSCSARGRRSTPTPPGTRRCARRPRSRGRPRTSSSSPGGPGPTR